VWRKLHNEEFNDLYWSPNIVRVIKSRWMRWAGTDSILKHCAANRERRLSALPNVGPYMYDVNISGFTRSSIYIYVTLVG
jgi:hypothetical protein